MIWTPVIQMLLMILTINPFQKKYSWHFLAIRYAHIIKMMTQNMGSILVGIQNTVAKAITNPYSDKYKISFQFIIFDF
jgi:hypothetical protein